tara:strand:+ start:405 stop:1241 length:837 start_codon:yes stop_codon:yes gene_type:complete
MRTFIRRSGNKSKLVKKILPLIPDYNGTYIEPFVGTGAVFLNLEPQKWIINDINKELIDAWKLVRDDLDFFINEINKIKDVLLSLDTKEKIKYCKGITSQIEKETDERLKAIKYHVMTYCSFQSTLEHSYSTEKYFFTGLYKPLFKSNTCHVFTDKYKEKIRKLEPLLRDGLVLNEDYCQVLEKAKAGDFVFLDPPYLGEKEYKFAYNSDEKIDEKFLMNLKEELNKLDEKSVKWMMTQVDSDLSRKYFNEYRIIELGINNGICDKLRKCELLVMNYL